MLPPQCNMASVNMHVRACVWVGVSVRDASASVGNEHHQLLNHPGGANGVHRPHFSATTAVHKHKTNKNVNKKGNTQTSVVSSCNVVLSLCLTLSPVSSVLLLSWQQQERGLGCILQFITRTNINLGKITLNT